MNFDFSKEPGKVLVNRYKTDKIEPLISIITPFYNSGQYFEQTFNSVLNQTFPYFEWIIINDGSTEQNDLDLLGNLIKYDSRIKLYHKENGGPATARNMGIDKSCTDIIIPLDADDLLEPTFIEYMYFALKYNPEASWAFSDSVGFQDKEYIWKQEFSSDGMKSINTLVCTAAIRKCDLFEVGGYSELAKHYNEDWHLWLKLLNLKKYPVHVNQIGFWYRRTNKGALATLDKDHVSKEYDKKVINDLTKTVPSGIRAVEFTASRKKEFLKPEKMEWNNILKYKQEKTNILMLIPHMEMGGADLFNLDIVSRLNKDLFEIGIITTIPNLSAWKQRFTEYVNDIFELYTFLDLEKWSSFVHYYIKSRKVDIVFITNSYYGYYLVPWLRKQFPNIAIIDYVHMEEWYWRAGGYARTSAVVSDVLEKTYVCNEHLREVMVKDFNRKLDDVETMYIGVDEQYFNDKNVVRGNLRKKFNIDEARPVILFPCRIHPQKRPYLMLEIAKEVKKVIANICFVVAGDGPQLEALKEKVKKEYLIDTVVFIGRCDDMRSLYADSDLTLICSIKEGLALTTYESMAMGVPVITSDAGGQRELVDNSVGRLLPLLQDEEKDLDNRNFSKEEINLYVQSIVELLSDKCVYQQYSNKCRKIIEEKFTKDKMISSIEKEFLAIKGGRGDEKRKEIAKAISILSNIADDYLSLYIEYEYNHGLRVRVYKIFQTVRDIVLFRISPVAVAKYVLKNRDHVYVKKVLDKMYLQKIANFIEKILRRSV